MSMPHVTPLAAADEPLDQLQMALRRHVRLGL